MTNFPKHITFLSDSTEVEFIQEIKDKKLKERLAEYKFTKAVVLKGKSVTLGLSQIEKLKSDNSIKIQ